MSNLFQTKFRSIPFSSLCYYGTMLFMLKTSYSFFYQDFYKKSKKKKMLKLLTQLKEKFIIKDQSTHSLEIIYYIYFQVLNEIYLDEIKKFRIQRRIYSKSNRFIEFISICQLFNREMKSIDAEILKEISKVFEIDFEVVKTTFSREEVNYSKMKGRYFSQREDLEIPPELDIKKTDEIIQFLHSKFLLFFNKIKKLKPEMKEEKAQLISEYYAFDCVFFQYNIEYEIIEKTLNQNNLSLVEY